MKVKILAISMDLVAKALLDPNPEPGYRITQSGFPPDGKIIGASGYTESVIYLAVQSETFPETESVYRAEQLDVKFTKELIS